MTAIPALTLHRPWTACITNLDDEDAKRVENRGWATKYRGPLYLHAGQAWADSARCLARDITGVGLWPDQCPTGIVAVVTLTDVCAASAQSWPLRCDCGPWAFPHQYHWRLADVRPLPKPVPCPGRQGLWRPPPEVVAAVAGQLAAVPHA